MKRLLGIMSSEIYIILMNRTHSDKCRKEEIEYLHNPRDIFNRFRIYLREKYISDEDIFEIG